jgi:hypothetical protein
MVPSGVFFGSAARATFAVRDRASAAMIPSKLRRFLMVNNFLWSW